MPDILRKYGQSDISGAFIADTLMNLNLTENSQMLPDKWSTVDKVTANKIKANGMKGDFMSIVQRRQPVSTKHIFRMIVAIHSLLL